MIETVAEHCKHEDCKYRGWLSFIGECCYFMYYTGESRRCPISECDRYKPGRIDWVLTLDGIKYIDDDV